MAEPGKLFENQRPDSFDTQNKRAATFEYGRAKK
jgi:hypothetical protein